jgi:GNAT superfamily N-acetyltransferase
MRSDRIVCWEPTDVNDPVVTAAGRLYEATLDADERIPWVWIERAVGEGRPRRPGGWVKHLVLAAPEGATDDPAALAGYAYGVFIPGYGGYLCYVGVAPAARGRGVGTRLFEAFVKLLAADAALAGEPLPFVVWESYRPTADDPPAAHALWAARVGLFARAGGRWVDGVEFLSPNFADESAPPVSLQLFVRPADEPAAAFTAERLRAVVGGLHERVYRQRPGTPLYDGTLPPGCHPRLRPAAAALPRPAAAPG